MEKVEIFEENGIMITQVIRSLDPYATPDLDRLFKEAYDREYAEKYSYLQKKETAEGKAKYIFLTVNPNTERWTIQDFLIGMTKMMSKPWIEKYLWVIEQRGETPDEAGRGFHFHAIVEKPHNKSFNHILREFKSSANRYCDTSKHSFFNVVYMGEAEKDRHITYITGRKADPAKHRKQDMDIIFRQKYGILSCYNVGIKKDAPET